MESQIHKQNEKENYGSILPITENEKENYGSILPITENEKQGIEAIATIKGVGENKFKGKIRVAVLSTDTTKIIYVLDTITKCITAFDGKKPNYDLIKTSKKLEELDQPFGLAVSAADNYIYIADTLNHRIKVIDATNFNDVTTFGSFGKKNDRFNLPIGIAVSAAADNRIYVADSGNHRIQVFVFNDKTFKYITTLGTNGSKGSTEKKFRHPLAVAVSASGDRIYVADTENYRVQVFKFERDKYIYLATLGTSGSKGSSNTEFAFPCRVEVSPVDNRIYVADSHNHRVQVFDGTTLQYIFTLGITGSAGDSNTQFNYPVSLAVSAIDNLIYVADNKNNRIQVFDVNKFSVDPKLNESTTTGGSKKRNTKKRNTKKRNMKKRNTKKQKYKLNNL